MTDSLSLSLPDFDNEMVSSISDTLIDADRLVRREWSNGFPNWALYRAALAGDALYNRQCREWAVMLSIAHCQTGGVKEGVYSEELACVAGWDAAHMLIHARTMQPYTVLAQSLDVDPKTYKRLRDAIYNRLRDSVRTYWTILGAKVRRVRIRESQFGPLEPRGKWSPGRGFGSDVDVADSGNFRASPAQTSEDY